MMHRSVHPHSHLPGRKVANTAACIKLVKLNDRQTTAGIFTDLHAHPWVYIRAGQTAFRVVHRSHADVHLRMCAKICAAIKLPLILTSCLDHLCLLGGKTQPSARCTDPYVCINAQHCYLLKHFGSVQ